jgi:hypothetical protein
MNYFTFSMGKKVLSISKGWRKKRKITWPEEYSLVVVLMFLVVYGGVAEREKEERETLGVSAGN